jgi:hypothetical protein
MGQPLGTTLQSAFGVQLQNTDDACTFIFSLLPSPYILDNIYVTYYKITSSCLVDINFCLGGVGEEYDAKGQNLTDVLLPNPTGLFYYQSCDLKPLFDTVSEYNPLDIASIKFIHTASVPATFMVLANIYTVYHID